ncbi:hypothetical protein LL033_17820 [Clostridium estertheticum]|uniref:hypothetical protein n=1 Tax=Clostridium estertheticum TaxID=238834 RepID=UPI001C0C3506|nr:hypothetical protein [Clostridium estertheticum]MBU3216527.1 hypothetical protein [Clostridium estertheticum]WAG54471.1 hypothetical protein LL033_17820 [Clostridium estertheticum]
MHTKHHCARVLLLALVIAHKMELSDEEIGILSMAAVFHDSRSLDDWLDTGHGKRAAEYYKESYSKYGISVLALKSSTNTIHYSSIICFPVKNTFTFPIFTI